MPDRGGNGTYDLWNASANALPTELRGQLVSSMRYLRFLRYQCNHDFLYLGVMYSGENRMGYAPKVTPQTLFSTEYITLTHINDDYS